MAVRVVVLCLLGLVMGTEALVGDRRALRRRCRLLFGSFRDAQRELMDGGAQVELGGDTWLAEAQALGFIEANLAMRTPRCRAGVAVKNCGRAVADVGAKFRNRGGVELAAYTMDEASVYLCQEAAKGLEDFQAPAAAAKCRALGEALSAVGKALYAASPIQAAVALQVASEALSAFATACAENPALAPATANLENAADHLRRGAEALGDGAQPPAPKNNFLKGSLR